MNVGSLFSGIGGIELGFERAGFETAWFIENDLHAQAVLRKRFPEAKIYDDVTKVDFGTIPRVDVLTGGFPCQDISVAGKRAGIQGSRSSLWKYYLEAIRTIRPRYCFIENVSALIGRGLDVVLADLASIGYDAEWHCISASSVGAPHRRDRVFIISYPSRNGCLHGQNEIESNETRQQALKNFESTRSNVSNSESWRCENGNQRLQCEDSLPGREQRAILSDSGDCQADMGYSNNGRKTSEILSRRNSSFNAGWWQFEPELGRVANGISNRVERIKRLGNAVVPACAEVFAKAIKEDSTIEVRTK